MNQRKRKKRSYVLRRCHTIIQASTGYHKKVQKCYLIKYYLTVMNLNQACCLTLYFTVRDLHSMYWLSCNLTWLDWYPKSPWLKMRNLQSRFRVCDSLDLAIWTTMSISVENGLQIPNWLRRSISTTWRVLWLDLKLHKRMEIFLFLGEIIETMTLMGMSQMNISLIKVKISLSDLKGILVSMVSQHWMWSNSNV